MNKMRFLVPIWFLVVAAIFAVAVMLLWNWLIPAIFGLTAVNYWQALGILVLCRLLFGSFGGGHGLMRRPHHAEGHPILNKWMKMTPEQRQEFINKRKEHFGKCGFFGGRNFDFDANENTPKNNE